MADPTLIADLPPEDRRTYARGVAWKLADGVLTGLGMVAAFGAVILAASGTVASWLIPGLVALSAVLILARYAVGAASIRATYSLSFAGGAATRHRLIRHLVLLPLSAFYQLHPGKVAQTLSEDMMWLENRTSYFGPMARAEVVTILVLLIGTAILHWPAALAAMVVWGLGLLAVAKLGRMLSVGLRHRSDGMAEASRHFMEYAEGIQVVRAFGDSDAAREDYGKWIEIMREGFRKSIARNTPVAILALGLAMSAVGVGAIAAVSTLPEDGALRAVGAIGLLTATLIPARSVITASTIDQLACVAEQNMAEIEGMVAVAEGAAEVEPGPARIAFENVSLTYEGADRPALRDVTFTAEPGTITAIVGPSGAGKTTLVNLILRFWDPDEGRVTLNGRDARDHTIRSYTDRIAPVFQETMLLRDTVATNLNIGRPDALEAEMIAAAKAAQVHDTIMALPQGYETEVGPGGQTLSGGERQRVTIARAILKDADIVILDEATSALDPENEREIQIAFEALARGKTVFVIAHRLSTITDADRILLLDEGCLVATGTHDDLMRDAPLYRDLWDSYRAITEWTL